MIIYTNCSPTVWSTLMIIVFGLVLRNWPKNIEKIASSEEKKKKRKFLYFSWWTSFFLAFVSSVWYIGVHCVLCACLPSILTTYPIIIEVVCVSFIENLFKTNSSVYMLLVLFFLSFFCLSPNQALLSVQQWHAVCVYTIIPISCVSSAINSIISHQLFII